MRRIGIYGGTFNPPHLGHIQGAKYAIEALDLDHVLLIPDDIPPHKTLPQGSGDPNQRLEMVTLAAMGEPNVLPCDAEILRGGISYTYQTIESLRNKYPEDELVLLMGGDVLQNFANWKGIDSILKNASVGVMFRGNAGEADAIRERIGELEQMGAKVYPIDNPIIQISSTQLRRMLVFRCAQPFLSEQVWDYIRKNRLYGAEDDYRNLPIDKLEAVVVSLLKPNRVNHVLGCRDAAVDLAKRWGADETDAARAGLLHDITKALDPFLQLTLCREYGIILDAFSQKNPKTLHALTGSLVSRHIFGENDAVVNAVRHHTTGKANMSLLEKIIYVADYMEPNRVFPGVEELRQLAYSDLDAALKRGLEMTVELLRQQGRTVSSESLEALEYLK